MTPILDIDRDPIPPGHGEGTPENRPGDYCPTCGYPWWDCLHGCPNCGTPKARQTPDVEVSFGS